MAWRLRRARPLVALGIALFLVGTLPNSGLIPFTYQTWSTVADRYLYWSMIGAALVFAQLLAQLRPPWALALGMLLLTSIGLRSALVQVPTWRDDTSLWAQVVGVAPGQSSAWSNLAEYLPDPAERAAAIRRALDLDPSNQKALNTRGLLAWNPGGDLQGAWRDFNAAVTVAPWYRPARLNRAAVNHRLGRLDAALADLGQLLREAPDDAQARLNRGLVHIQRRQLRAAETDLRHAMALEPDNGKPIEALAMVMLLRDEHDQARALTARATALGFVVQPALQAALGTDDDGTAPESTGD